jgi:hypothetical protein
MENALTHQLNPWANWQKVATLFYAAKEDLWFFKYAPS